MISRSTKIAIDIDGVLADFAGAFIDTANRLNPGSVPLQYSPPDYNFSDLVPASDFPIILASIFETLNLWETLRPLRGVFELTNFLPSLCREKIDIYYVTHRPQATGESSLVQTQRWLQGYGLLWPGTSILVTTSAESKTDIYRHLDIQFSVDDKPETVRECLKIPGHTAYLFDATWNRGAVHMDLPRVRSLEEFLKEVFSSLDSLR